MAIFTDAAWAKERLEIRARKLAPAERAVFEQAQRDGYLTARSSALQLANVWCLWCEANDAPDIRIIPRRKYAAVTLDMIFATWRLKEEAGPVIHGLLRPYVMAFDTVASWGTCFASCGKVPLEEAADVAQALARIAREYRADLAPAVYD